MEGTTKSKAETWVQEDDVIYNVIPISYAYPVDNTNEVRPSTSKRKPRTTKSSSDLRGKPRSKGTRVDKVSPSTSKRKPRTTKSSSEKLSDDWKITEKPRPDGSRVDKTYYHKTKDVTLRSEISALYYQTYGTFPPKKSKPDGNKDLLIQRDDSEEKEEEAENM